MTQSEDSAAALASHVNWYAVFTMPRHEKTVAQSLARNEIEHFLPLYERVNTWKNRQKVCVSLPLFPRYLFARIGREGRLPILQTAGVVRIVGAGPTPSPISDVDVEFLRDQVKRKQLEPYPELAIGKRVCIKSGPMAGVEGVLVRRQNGMRFVITLQLIQQSASVEISPEELEEVRA
jgi:transcription antitermination factor NusG